VTCVEYAAAEEIRSSENATIMARNQRCSFRQQKFEIFGKPFIVSLFVTAYFLPISGGINNYCIISISFIEPN
jgi:hypothetical protein